jgi:hypothetical protein
MMDTRQSFESSRTADCRKVLSSRSILDWIWNDLFFGAANPLVNAANARQLLENEASELIPVAYSAQELEREFTETFSSLKVRHDKTSLP